MFILSQVNECLTENQPCRIRLRLPFIDRNLGFVSGLVVILLVEVRIGEQVVSKPALWVGCYGLLHNRLSLGIVLALQIRPAQQRER